ncbi:PKD domain-containing protein [Vallicoccus soli]|uniref:PKD domain-containing protein n=1 Tax=Vallicoccus soli TaxID=2339232 RepID=UPI001059BAEE|nr:PKD domain-containing protein [Vallicoccus soli]
MLAAGAAVLALAAQPVPAGAVTTPVHTGVVSADPVDSTPHVLDGAVRSIVQVGDVVVVGGSFTSVAQTRTSAPLPRSGLFAFSASTGTIVPGFDPAPDGAVQSLDSDGTSLYVGGTFTRIAGATQRRLAKLTLDGRLAAGQPRVPNSRVNDVVVRGSRLYAAGAFTAVGGTPRGALAALDKDTGALLPQVDVPFSGIHNSGTTNIQRFDVAHDGSELVAVGNFSTVAGEARRQIARVALPADGPAALSPWATTRYTRPCASKAFDTYMRDVDYAPDGSYFVVTTTGAFDGGQSTGTLCDTAARWDTAPTTAGQDPAWVDYTGGDTLYGVEVTGSVVYVGGHMRWMNNPFQSNQAGPGAVAREGVAALDPVNGLPLAWNPGRTRGVGAEALHATEQGLWVGSDTDRLGGEYHGRVAFLPLEGGYVPRAQAATTLPTTLYAGRTAAAGAVPAGLAARPFDGTAAGPATVVPVPADLDWGAARGAFVAGGQLYLGQSDGRLVARALTTDGLGPARDVDLRNDPDNGAKIPWTISGVTGMAYDAGTGRVYYTRSGSAALYYRYFTLDGEVPGAQELVAATTGFTGAAGLAVAGGELLWGSSVDGHLRAVPLVAGRPAGAARTVVADGTWRTRALFASSEALAPVPNAAPVAQVAQQCDPSGACTFDASGSSDADGTVVSYAWDLGDGTTASGPTATRAYADGTWTVRLTVTDDRGATATTETTVVVQAPPAQAEVGFVGATGTSGNAVTLGAPVPDGVRAGDALLLSLSVAADRVPAAPAGLRGWTLLGDAVGARGELHTFVWHAVAEDGDAGRTVSVALDARAKATLAVLAYTGAEAAPPAFAAVAETASRAEHAAPALPATTGSWVVSGWADKSSATTGWTAPAGTQERSELVTDGSGRVTSLVADSGAPVPAGTAGGLTAVADSASAKAVAWTAVLRPRT